MHANSVRVEAGEPQPVQVPRRQRRELLELAAATDPPHLGRRRPASFAEPADLDDRRDAARRRLVAAAVADQVDVDDEVDGLGDQAPHRELGQVVFDFDT